MAEPKTGFIRFSIGMNRKLGLCLVGGMAVAAFGASQFAQQYDIVATASSATFDGQTLTQEGACSFDDTQVKCWNSSGTPDSGLTSEVQSYLMRNENPSLTYGFRKKNRIVLFSRSNAKGFLQVFAANGTYLSVVQTPRASGYLGLAVLKANYGDKTADLVANLSGLAGSEPVRIPAVEGAKTNYESWSIEFGGSKQRTVGDSVRLGIYALDAFGDSSRPMDQAHAWSYYFVVKSAGKHPISLLSKAIDKLGAEIKYVNQKGYPVSALEFAKQAQPPAGQPKAKPQPRRYLSAYMNEQAVNDNIVTLSSNVNPAAIGAFDVSGSHQVSVLFKDIPLDPR